MTQNQTTTELSYRRQVPAARTDKIECIIPFRMVLSIITDPQILIN